MIFLRNLKFLHLWLQHFVFYFQYEDALPHFQKSLNINALQVSMEIGFTELPEICMKTAPVSQEEVFH